MAVIAGVAIMTRIPWYFYTPSLAFHNTVQVLYSVILFYSKLQPTYWVVANFLIYFLFWGGKGGGWGGARGGGAG